MALGATGRGIRAMVVARASTLTAVGVVLGIGLVTGDQPAAVQPALRGAAVRREHAHHGIGRRPHGQRRRGIRTGAARIIQSIHSDRDPRRIGSPMENWKALVRARLAPLAVDPAREADIVDELAQHVAEHYTELVASGVPESDAIGRALAPLDDPAHVAAEIARADRPRSGGAASARRTIECSGRLRSRRALCGPSVATYSGLYRCRAGDARARHRRQHRDLQRRQRRPAAAAAVRVARAPGDDWRSWTRWRGGQRRLHDVPRLARPQPRVRGDGAHPLLESDV